MLLLTLCCACSREPLDGEFIDMSGYDVPCIEAVEVKHRVTEEECYGIFDVRTAEGKVIITKEFSDNLIHVIDPESGAVAATVLHLGRGPGEAVNSYYIGMSEDRSRFWAKDLALNQINIFDTRSVLQGSRQPLIRHLPPAKGHSRPEGLCPPLSLRRPCRIHGRLLPLRRGQRLHFPHFHIFARGDNKQ